ncbi:hypothetical protein F5B21DRAFT_520500 [Xylaria acuta]|nr:hypothetical protein F5B21DRAFT_520500 [Xylaria acuta]
MEPLAALGLASNTVQLVDFTSKLVTNAKTLYKSRHETSADSLVLREVVGGITRLSDAIIIKGQKTKWKSLLVAAKEVRSQEAVTAITRSITRLQTQMTFHLQIQNKISSMSEGIQRLQTTSVRLQLNNTNQIEKLRADLLNASNSINASSKNQYRKYNKCSGRRSTVNPERLTIDDFHATSQRLPSYESSISVLSRNKISPANVNTFEWVFSDVLPDGSSRVGFRSWLRSGNGIFWIRGKPGSGKPTLMKFISQHPTTLDHLKCWSGSLQLVMGSFYFWNSDTDLQKSQEGLLRSLIFEILRGCPELVIHAQTTLLCTKGKSSFMQTIQREGWTLPQLIEILDSILSHNHSHRFCFIIDSLDEFKARYTQDQQELVNLLRKLAASPNIKLCVSSRPWTVFVDAFNGGISQCLKLEDLTGGDIRSYALDKLSGHNQFRKLTQIDPGYSALVDEVLTKSQGVFLWVVLVVRELPDGLTYNHTIGEMHRRLESFPDTLDEFFQHMLGSVDKIYLPQTIRVFQLSTSGPEPLPMLYYSFLGDIEQGLVLIRKLHDTCPGAELLQRRDAMQRKLDAWCKGLLELVEAKQETHFLHRCARGFLVSGGVGVIAQQSNCERQRTWLLFCKSIIHFIIRSPPYDHHTWGTGAAFDNLASEIGRKVIAWFLRAACSHGLTDYVKLKLLSDQGSLKTANYGLISFSTASCYEPELIRCLISGAEMSGRTSKVVLADYFRSFMVAMTQMMQRSLRREDALDIIKVIASTGYELDEKFINTHFHQHYTEIVHLSHGSRGIRTRQRRVPF